MLSGRFDGKEKEAFLRATGKALEARGCITLVVEASGGEMFGQQTMSALSDMDVMIAFAFDDYGEKTKSSYCSFYEVKYCLDHKKPIVPLRLYDGEWPPAGGGQGTPGYEQNQFVFTPDLVRFSQDPKGKKGPAWDLNKPEACAEMLVQQIPHVLAAHVARQLDT